MPTWVKDRLVCYVYRVWPVLRPVPEKEDDKGKMVKLDFGYIDKLAEPIELSSALQDKYGAGDYHLKLNDPVVDERTIADIYVRENFRDIRAFPPTDRRIDDVSNVDLDELGNKGYVAYLKSQGKLPDQSKEASNMAEASAVTQVTGMMGKMFDKAMDRGQAEGTAAAEGIKVVANAAIKGQEMLADAAKRADAMRTTNPPPDPIETVEKVMGLVEKMRPQNSGGELVAQFMEMFKITLGVQNSRIEFAEKVAMEAKKVADNPQAGTEAKGGGNDLASAVRQFAELREVLGGFGGGGGADPWYKDPSALTAVLQGVGMVLGNGVALYQTHVRAQEVARGIVNGTVVSAPVTTAANAPGTLTPATQDKGAGMEEEEDQMQFAAFLGAIAKPFLSHFDMDTDDVKGALFAEWLIEGYGKSTYDNMRTAGKDALIMALRTFNPIGREIKGKEQLVDKFVDEFMRMEEIRAKEQREDEEREAAEA